MQSYLEQILGISPEVNYAEPLEERIRERTAELQARNEELTAYGHTVAHDLKGPLTLVIGYAELLEEDYAAMSGKELQKYLQAIAQHGRKMCSIIDALLLLAELRDTEVEVVPLDMASLVAGTRWRLASMIEESHAEIILPKVWPVASGYGPWVEEVWINYLSNAIKYGGRPPRLELGAREQTNGLVRFWVHDNGPGIPPEAQPGSSYGLCGLIRNVPKAMAWDFPSCGTSWRNSADKWTSKAKWAREVALPFHCMLQMIKTQSRSDRLH